jgi:hypothetical protein
MNDLENQNHALVLNTKTLLKMENHNYNYTFLLTQAEAVM